ncbi:hypothetical protein ACLMAJ_35320 [Nocardia sp. KC 131]
MGGDPPVPVAGDGAFSLADPATVDGTLTAAGFTDVRITDECEPIYCGADPDVAIDVVPVLRMASDLLAQLDADKTERALERLRRSPSADRDKRYRHRPFRDVLPTAASVCADGIRR